MLQTQTPAPTAGQDSPAHTDAEEQASLARLLSASGERLPDSELDPWVAELDGPAIAALYQDMAVIRRLDAEGTALQRQGELALWPPLLGQEASQIGSARALRGDDFVFASYRDMGVAWARGLRGAELTRAWRGNAASGWDPLAERVAPMQVIIGAQTLHATGYALGIQNDGADSAAVTYFGDGATSQGDVNEAMVFAASFQAPVVFICQNNHWAISEPVGLQARRPIADRAPGFGIPSMRVDGNDVLAMLAATRIALDRARTGGGPSFIEAVTYRMGPHTTADDPRRYRDPAELELWATRDPLARVEALLRGLGAFTPEFEQQVADAADSAAAELRAETIGMPDPAPSELFDHVYAEPHTGLERERADYLRYLAQFEEPTPAGATGGQR